MMKVEGVGIPSSAREAGLGFVHQLSAFHVHVSRPPYIDIVCYHQILQLRLCPISKPAIICHPVTDGQRDHDHPTRWPERS